MHKALVKFDEVPQTLMEAVRWRSDIANMKNAIKHHTRKTTEHYLICGYLLWAIDKNKSWAHDGSCAQTFFYWVENEIGFKRTTAQRMMSSWVMVAPLLKDYLELILDIDSSKLALIAPYMGKLNEDSQIELLHTAQTSSVRVLEGSVLRELDGKIPQDSCAHNGVMEDWLKCPTCHKFFKK